MRRLHYHRVNVFTDRAFSGNPLAVITNGRGVVTETMQAIAKEFNLSETTFVVPPDDQQHDWRLRIFTPVNELPMAGHPTVGTSFVLAREHLIDTTKREANIVLEEGVGPIAVRVEFNDGSPSYAEMSQPLPVFGPRFDNRREDIADMISLSPEDLDPDLPVEVISCGVPTLIIALRNLDAARRARPRTDVMMRLAKDGAPHLVLVFTSEVEFPGSTVHTRVFSPLNGVPEDPATGAASGPLGCYLVRHDVVVRENASKIVSEQGIEMGRTSFISISVESANDEISAVKIGGQCQFVGEGFIEV